MHRSDYASAGDRSEEALLLYRRVDNVLGEANCFLTLGHIAFRRSDYPSAGSHYQEALPLYRRVGHTLGEANCIKSLGNIAHAKEDQEIAIERWQKALKLYERVAEPYSIGLTHLQLARAMTNETDRSHHVQAARDAWHSIDRSDLIADLDEEFGSE